MINEKQTTFYDYLGEQRLKTLISIFYDKVSKHEDLKVIFPSDLTETKRKQTQFLTQFFGGPDLYTQEHGHPFLRKRHLDFAVTPQRAQAWLQCMKEALDEIELDPQAKEFIMLRLTTTANHMVNTN